MPVPAGEAPLLGPVGLLRRQEEEERKKERKKEREKERNM